MPRWSRTTCALDLVEPSLPDRARYPNSGDNVTGRPAKERHSISQGIYEQTMEEKVKEEFEIQQMGAY